MLQFVARDFTHTEWSKIVSGLQGLSLMQTWEYGMAKAETGPWRVEHGIFIDGERVVGAVQALVRPIPWLKGGLVWINRGPLRAPPEDGDSLLLAAMMDEIRTYWVENRHMYLRIAPPSFEGEVDVSALEAVGYRLDDRSKGWGSARVDLSRPIEALREQLQQKWRNCLNKADRLEITVESGSHDPNLEQFLIEYRQMLEDRKYETSVTPDLLSLLQRLFPAGDKLWVLAARQNGQSLGTVVIARYGSTSEYLAGMVNGAGRAANAGQLLLWRAVCEMKELGYRWFDLGGMDLYQTPSGIFHFKAGLGGTPYRLVGEFEAHDGRWVSKMIRWRVHQVRQAAGR